MPAEKKVTTEEAGSGDGESKKFNADDVISDSGSNQARREVTLKLFFWIYKSINQSVCLSLSVCLILYLSSSQVGYVSFACKWTSSK